MRRAMLCIPNQMFMTIVQAANDLLEKVQRFFSFKRTCFTKYSNSSPPSTNSITKNLHIASASRLQHSQFLCRFINVVELEHIGVLNQLHDRNFSFQLLVRGFLRAGLLTRNDLHRNFLATLHMHAQLHPTLDYSRRLEGANRVIQTG